MVNIEQKVKELVLLEESSFPSARAVLSRRATLRELVLKEMSDGAEFPDSSPFYAKLKKMPGRVSYKGLVDYVVREHPELEDEIKAQIKEYRDAQRDKLKYGRK